VSEIEPAETAKAYFSQCISFKGWEELFHQFNVHGASVATYADSFVRFLIQTIN
jgi:hypothetical protein